MPTSTPAKTVKPDKTANKAAPASEAGAKQVDATTTKCGAKCGCDREHGKELRFNDKDLQHFRKELMALRDRLTGQVARMRQDSLTRDDEVNTEEDGTDAFDRLFALERAGSDQDMIFTIDESIIAIDEGKYGQCEGCGHLIEKPRLQALPFAKNCIKCQSEMERSRNHGAARRQVP